MSRSKIIDLADEAAMYELWQVDPDFAIELGFKPKHPGYVEGFENDYWNQRLGIYPLLLGEPNVKRTRIEVEDSK